MLDPLGLFVDLVVAVAQRDGEICLDHAMTPDRPHRGAAAGTRETHASIALVLDQLEVGEAADHAADRRRCEAKRFGDVVRSDDAPVDRLELEDDLEIVLDRRRYAGHGTHRVHETAGAAAGMDARGVARRSPRTSSTGIRERCRTSFATLP